MQKKSIVAILVLAGAVLLFNVPSFAQAAQSAPGATTPPHTVTDQDIEMLRQDIRAQRKEITAQNMTLTADEATKFWPIFDQYRKEAVTINDERWALIKQYASSYNTITDAQANDFMKRATAVDDAAPRFAYEVRSNVREGHLTQEDCIVVPDRSPYRSPHQFAVVSKHSGGGHEQVSSPRKFLQKQRIARCAAFCRSGRGSCAGGQQPCPGEKQKCRRRDDVSAAEWAHEVIHQHCIDQGNECQIAKQGPRPLTAADPHKCGR